jgi:hypothetical protein
VFLKVPGLINEIELMAWTHRSQAPIIVAIASDIDVDGSAIQVAMIPRSFWDEDPRFLDAFTAAQREGIRTLFGEASFSASTDYVCLLCTEPQGTFVGSSEFRADGPICAVEIR